MQEFEFVPKSVSLKQNIKPDGSSYNMYNLLFVTSEGFDFAAVTFNASVAEDLEKAIAEKRKVKIECTTKEFNGAKSYTVVKVDGKQSSGFGPRGKGMQKDQIGIERSVAAKIAGDWLNNNVTEASEFRKQFKGLAEIVYTWVSARPSAPEAAGGQAEQAPPHDDRDAPVDLNDHPY